MNPGEPFSGQLQLAEWFVKRSANLGDGIADRLRVPIAVAENEVDRLAREEPHRTGRFDVAAMQEQLGAGSLEFLERRDGRLGTVMRVAQDANLHGRPRRACCVRMAYYDGRIKWHLR